MVNESTNVNSTEDEGKLREKVDEALAVYHDYAKTQGGGNTDGASDQPATGAEGENAKP